MSRPVLYNELSFLPTSSTFSGKHVSNMDSSLDATDELSTSYEFSVSFPSLTCITIQGDIQVFLL